MTKKSSPDDREKVWSLFLRSHTLLMERIETALSSKKMPPLSWYDVLWELEKADSSKLRMHELAERIVLSRSNLTRLADRLEKKGLICREYCPHDRRGAFCAITTAGKEMRRKMWPVYRKEIEELFSKHLSTTDVQAMVACLRRIVDAALAGPT